MNRRSSLVVVSLLCLLLFPQRAPAPLIYTPGEGWRYEKVGGGNWVRDKPKAQLDVAIAAFEQKDYGIAIKASRHILNHRQWRFSEYAPQAQYLLGRAYEAKGQDEKAFKAYRELIRKYPKLDNFDEVVLRQFVIADKFLAGQWFKLWGYIPFFPSMDKTIKMYEEIIKDGPYSKVAPYAQLRIGAAHEKKVAPAFEEAAKAYERAADRYSDQQVGTDGLYKAGVAFQKQAKRAEYDQSVAGQAIATFTDFIALHPQDQRVSEAQKFIDAMKIEQARGSFEVARFYEKKHRWDGALIYYNEVLLKDPGSQYADAARQRIDSIKKRVQK
jgi:outer membrane protein assembly factor BamD (BamD/ComL family)